MIKKITVTSLLFLGLSMFFISGSLSGEPENQLIKDSQKYLYSPKNKEGENGLKGVIEYGKNKLDNKEEIKYNESIVSNKNEPTNQLIGQKKQCPKCKRIFKSDFLICPYDGMNLVELPEENANNIFDKLPSVSFGFKVISVRTVNEFVSKLKRYKAVKVDVSPGILDYFEKENIVLIFRVQNRNGWNWNLFSFYMKNGILICNKLTDNEKLGTLKREEIILAPLKGTSKFLIRRVEKCGISFYLIDAITGEKSNKLNRLLTVLGKKPIYSSNDIDPNGWMSCSIDWDESKYVNIFTGETKEEPKNRILRGRFSKHLYLQENIDGSVNHFKYFRMNEDGEVFEVFDSRNYIENDIFEAFRKNYKITSETFSKNDKYFIFSTSVGRDKGEIFCMDIINKNLNQLTFNELWEEDIHVSPNNKIQFNTQDISVGNSGWLCVNYDGSIEPFIGIGYPIDYCRDDFSVSFLPNNDK